MKDWNRLSNLFEGYDEPKGMVEMRINVLADNTHTHTDRKNAFCSVIRNCPSNFPVLATIATRRKRRAFCYCPNIVGPSVNMSTHTGPCFTKKVVKKWNSFTKQQRHVEQLLSSHCAVFSTNTRYRTTTETDARWLADVIVFMLMHSWLRAVTRPSTDG